MKFLNRNNIALLSYFMISIFLSAFLLFSLQPLFTKLVLPKLGGTPAVWSVAMVFFQTLLLAGYGYAHILSTRLSFRTAVFVHCVILILAFFWLPPSIARGWETAPVSGQGYVIWLLGLFSVSIGVPFFALSANAPLLQAWFARSRHPHARDPYFLYGASNTGSLLALLSYPVVVEPLFSLSTQTFLWMGIYAVLFIFIALSGFTVLLSKIRIPEQGTPAEAGRDREKSSKPITGLQRFQWVCLAFIPSALLIAVTAHISTDIASAPFLWVIPLALFLLTFVLTFNPAIRISASVLEWGYLLVVLLLAASVFAKEGSFLKISLALGGNSALVFLGGMVCHNQLYSKRPEARYLTEFYLWMSLGGVLGGVFTTLLAPWLFKTSLEYSLLIVAVFLAFRHVHQVKVKFWVSGVIYAVLIILLSWLVAQALSPVFDITKERVFSICMIFLLLPGFFFFFNRTALIVSVSFISIPFFTVLLYEGSMIFRNFFGTMRIEESEDGRYRKFSHGTTYHGIEKIRDKNGLSLAGPSEPLVYYHVNSPMAESLRTFRQKREGGPLSIAIIGLGVGSLACYAEEGERWTFYEI